MKAAIAVALSFVACGSTVSRQAQPAPSSTPADAAAVGSSPSASSSTPVPPRLEGEALGTLEVDGFLPPSLAIPLGAEEPRPIVIAVHGNGDRAEWLCEVWAAMFQYKAFVLCPAGKLGGESSPGDPRYTFSHHLVLEKEIDADLAALRASRFASWLRPERPVYAGFSLGAMMAIPIAGHRAADFPTLVLVEGGLEKLTDEKLQRFVADGGKRILFACSEGRACADASKLFADRLTAHGGQGAAVYAGPVGHRYDGPVAEAVGAALPGFLEAEPEWKGLLSVGSP